jgi:polysaccharide pyruvyl transferase WcaK-like protein
MIKKITTRWYEILLLPHSLHPIDESSHDGYYLQDFLFPGVRTTQSIEQTLEAYKTCRIIISMRLHSMILAIDHHTPFIGISYGQKTNQLLREIDWKYTCQALWDDVIKYIAEIEENYAQISSELEKIHTSQRENYNTILSSIVWK